MSKRSERREADRLSRKTAYQELRTQPNAAVASPEPAISQAQLDANRANAQKSTGATSPEGKAKSSMNALKHGLTSQTLILTGEEKLEYGRQFDSYLERHNPANIEEVHLVQSMLDSQWRLDRILRMESAIIFKGEIEFANQFEDRTPLERESLILAGIYLKYEKSFRNLHIQEARLRRCREKDQAELLRLQTIRQREERLAAEAAETNPQPPAHQPFTPQPAPDGFVFSTSEIDCEERGSQAALGSSGAAIAEQPRSALPAFSEEPLSQAA